ncbi:anthranilate synthase component I family protein [Swingsia samuiensis]|uniref:Anthranilate synthase component I family protein n=1 Tax=Swingsia samuiensis TaxID=1293412 RepID=A0A4Y6UHL7_9PROT|nr:anthranilate synthase component I family protein [Swingsia samuiensis]QDH17002.1 anthranilate synthase component I family protein [Swingsia samuiensis]
MIINPLVQELPWKPPSDALSLLKDQPWAAFLDSGGSTQTQRGRWSYIGLYPSETLTVEKNNIIRNDQYVSGSVWDHLQEMAQSVQHTLSTHIPFYNGVIGMASYEAGLYLENVLSRHHSCTPLFIAATYNNILAFDRQEQKCWWVSKDQLPPPTWPYPFSQNQPLSLDFQAEQSSELYQRSVQKIINYIGAGDIFQANLTMRWFAKIPYDFNEIAAYDILRTTSPAPFGAYLKSPHFSLLSASVERFISLSSDGRIETRPIKGTAPLGKTAQEQEFYTAKLASDPKENAENLMITDLMRNDIGKISQLGSVHVPELSRVEQFQHVLHLVSSVQGKIQTGFTAIDLLKATLPPGSVTGAPKKRALEIIDEVETSSRGAYCGSVFRIGQDGSLDSSVIIRSISRTPSHLSIGAGGGITWLSDPQKEYNETLLKAAPLLKAFQK